MKEQYKVVIRKVTTNQRKAKTEYKGGGKSICYYIRNREHRTSNELEGDHFPFSFLQLLLLPKCEALELEAPVLGADLINDEQPLGER